MQEKNNKPPPGCWFGGTNVVFIRNDEMTISPINVRIFWNRSCTVEKNLRILAQFNPKDLRRELQVFLKAIDF